MTEGKNILCISNTTWEGFYTKSTVQIMSLLARSNNILFVEYPSTIKDVITTVLGKSRTPVLRMLGLKKRLITVKPEPGVSLFHLVIPPVIPIEFLKLPAVYNFLLKINSRIYAKSVRSALRKLQMENIVCVNAYNAIYGNTLIGKLDEKLHVFYCYDGPNTGRYGQKAVAADQSFSGKVDGVIVTSEFLANTLRDFNSEIHVVKNGVDFKLFNQYAKKSPSKKGTRKKIGYIGSLDQRFDIDTIEYTIEKLSEYDFEFTGDLMNREIERRISKYHNVRFMLPVPPDAVPALLQKCDAGLIPYLCNEYTKNIYPLKINEYLSVGVPVVLTSFAVLPEFNEIVSFTSGKEEFCEALVREIEGDSMEKIEKRIHFAANNSWEERANQFDRLVGQILEKREMRNDKTKNY